MQNKLNNAVIADVRSKEKITDAVLMVQIVQGKSLVEYAGDENLNFIKITVALPRFIVPAKRLLEGGTAIQGYYCSIFESNVDIEMR